MTEQRTPEWFASRLGKVTASRIREVVALTKNGYGASRDNYMAELIVERLTKQRSEGFINAAMQWGIDNEAAARAAYEFYRDVEVIECGSIDHPTIPMSSASPDGLVLADGMVEIKCPNTATHITTLLFEVIPAKYIDQMQWQMACADRSWNDFVSYDPRLPEHLRFFCKRLERDDKRIAFLEQEVKTFLGELDKKMKALS